MIKPATSIQATDIDMAIHFLRLARNCLIRADAPKATDAVRKALKSTEGAQRHIQGRLLRGTQANT